MRFWGAGLLCFFGKNGYVEIGFYELRLRCEVDLETNGKVFFLCVFGWLWELFVCGAGDEILKGLRGFWFWPWGWVEEVG